MDFAIPKEITDLLVRIDDFIEREIKPLEQQDDNIRFFDHRREWARTDFEHGGLPRKDWEAILGEMRRRADKAGFLRLRCRRNSAARISAISRWRSSASIWPPKGSDCTTICRTKPRSWAIFRRC